jgi:hypothetical protein
VSTAVKILSAMSNQKTYHFAVRSGGHTPIPGANNVHDGVTIDFLYMNSTTYDANTILATILPAARWGSVYAALSLSDAW